MRIIIYANFLQARYKLEMAGRSRSVGDLDRIGMDRSLDPILDRDRDPSDPTIHDFDLFKLF